MVVRHLYSIALDEEQYSPLVEYAGQVSLGIRKAFTLCKVDREGCASGFDVVMNASRRRIRDLLIAFEVAMVKRSTRLPVS